MGRNGIKCSRHTVSKTVTAEHIENSVYKQNVWKGEKDQVVSHENAMSALTATSSKSGHPLVTPNVAPLWSLMSFPKNTDKTHF